MHNNSQAVTGARSLPGLADATNEELEDLKEMSFGTSIHWPRLDVQYTCIPLSEEMFGVKTVHSVVAKGGSARTQAKSAVGSGLAYTRSWAPKLRSI